MTQFDIYTSALEENRLYLQNDGVVVYRLKSWLV